MQDCTVANTGIEEALQKLADQESRCKIKTYKDGVSMVEAGAAKSGRDACRKMSEQTGEPFETVYTRYKRGKKIVGSGEPTQTQFRQKSQRYIWSMVERKLKSLKNYMEGNCRLDADINSNLAGKILDHLDFIKTYEDEFLNKRYAHE